jgi:hypothetical protein
MAYLVPHEPYSNEPSDLVECLHNDRIEIGVARPQHDSNPSHNYPSEKEVCSPDTFWGQRKTNSFSPETVGTDGHGRTVEIPSNGCATEPIALWFLMCGQVGLLGELPAIPSHY